MSSRASEWSTPKLLGVWALQLLVVAAFVMAGGSKLAGAESMVETFDKIGVGQWFRYVTGLLEVVGAGLVLYPGTAFFGGALLGSVMVGAIITHLAVIGGSALPPLVLLVLVAMVAWYRRP